LRALLLLLLLCLPGLQAQTPHAEERRREGDTLYVQCPYTAKDDKQWKAWARIQNGNSDILVYTGYNGREGRSTHRITISDNSTARIVSVTMTGLKAEDSGTYSCVISGPTTLKTISLNVFKDIPGVFQEPSSTQPRSQAMSLSNSNTFVLLSVVLSILLILALITSVTLCVRLHRLLERTGNREAEDTCDSSGSTAQLGSAARRESSKEDSRGLKHSNQDLQSWPSTGDPVYSNIEPGQAHRSTRAENVEYAVIAF
ncbi:CLM5 protein, partial [Pitta sordida]|nr:CLM5 protein [Pitta sordida]